VRPFERVLVWGRDPGKAAACAADLKVALRVEAEVTTDPAQLVARSQLVVTTTPARDPVLRRRHSPRFIFHRVAGDAPAPFGLRVSLA
jgi:ornithine cyclodeaminase/alanine dehydrogenase-like protein (mu-crystallin family)